MCFAEEEWRSELAAALYRQLRQLTAADSLTVLEAFSSWCSSKEQQQQPQVVDVQLQRLLGGLLVQTAAASATFSAQQVVHVLATLGLKMRFRAVEPAHESAITQLLGELSHAHNLTVLNNKQLVQLLQALNALRVAPAEGFMAAVQRDGVKPRVVGLKPQEFADLAQALAGLGVQMEYDVMDGYWTDLEGRLRQLTGAWR